MTPSFLLWRFGGFFFSGLPRTGAAEPREELKMNMTELDGLASDVDALFGISGLKEDLIDVAMLGASAGIAVVGFELAYTKIDMLRMANPWVKAGVAGVVGVGGGIAVARFANRSVGAGIAAGLIGWGVAKVVQKVAKLESAGLGQVSDRDLLLGMGVVDNDITVSDYRAIPGQTNGLEANDFTAMPGQVGQAGNVGVQDLQSMPGMNGRDSYLSAIG